MRLNFPDIFDRDKGKTGFVLGLGNSLAAHVDYLESIDENKEQYKIISCNNIDRLLPNLKFDYWALAQPADPSNDFCMVKGYQRYNASKAMLLYTDCLDLTPRKWVAEHLTIDYIGYDQRHWGGRPCDWGNLPQGRHICCAGIDPDRKCIQEYFMQYTKTNDHYGAGDTVGVHMVAIAVMLGLNPIYITGIDLDYTKGYVHNRMSDNETRIKMGISNINNNPKIIERILMDLKRIKDAAANIGVQIYDWDGTGKISAVFEKGEPAPLTV